MHRVLSLYITQVIIHDSSQLNCYHSTCNTFKHALIKMSLFFAYIEYKLKLYFKVENKQTDVRILSIEKCIEIM